MRDEDNYIDQDAVPETVAEEVVEETVPETETTTEEAEEAAEEEGGEEEGAEEEQPHKKKSGVQRLKEKLQAEREARIRAEERAKVLEETRAKPADPKPAPATETAKARPPKPDINTFEGTQAEYLEARDAWLLGEFEAKQEAKAKEPQANTEKQTRQSTWDTRVQDAKTRLLDLDQVLNVPFATPAMQDAILDLEHGVDVAYHLAKNLPEAKRIAALTPVAQILEIGKLETKLTAAKPPAAAKSTTQAPAPPTAVKPRAAAVAAPSKDDGGLEEY